jgi:SAM-dependent methyltransferase
MAERVESLHEMNPAERFSDRAADYARYRPSYPAAAIDAVLEGLGEASELHAVDVGAGTGIASRLLAERGVAVTAVEPNAEMRAAAAAHPRVVWVDGRGEATGLPDLCADLVVSAQAFHWLEPEAGLGEFARVLRPGGRLALMWNEGDMSDAMTAAYSRSTRASVEMSPVLRAWEPAEVFWRHPAFGGQREVRFANGQNVTLEGLIGRAFSASWVPKEGPRADAVVKALKSAHEQFADENGLVSLRYVTRVFLAERSAAAGA